MRRKTWLLPPVLLLKLCLYSVLTCAVTLTNVTVDDTLGSPDGSIKIVYSPEGSWSLGQDCTTCEADVDASQASDGTWHDTTYLSDNPPTTPLSANLTFDGVAVYVYCIITRASTDPFGNTDMTFILDGEEVSSIQLAPDGNATYVYNFPVYANDSLPPGQHTLALINGRKGGQTALALLDYMIFSRSREDNVSSSSAAPLSTESTPTSSSNTGSTSTTSSPSATNSTSSKDSNRRSAATAGGVVCGAVVIAIIAGLVVFFRRKRTARKGVSSSILEAKPRNVDDGYEHAVALPFETEFSSASTFNTSVFPLLTRPSTCIQHRPLIPEPYLIQRPTDDRLRGEYHKSRIATPTSMTSPQSTEYTSDGTGSSSTQFPNPINAMGNPVSPTRVPQLNSGQPLGHGEVMMRITEVSTHESNAAAEHPSRARRGVASDIGSEVEEGPPPYAQ